MNEAQARAQADADADTSANETLAPWLFGLVGLGDIGVGALVVVHPPLLGGLIGHTLGPAGEIAARLLGCAAAALGLGWWSARHRPAARATQRAGMLLYNFGAGLVFAVAATSAAQALLPALVGALHLGLGVVALRIGTKVQ